MNAKSNGRKMTSPSTPSPSGRGPGEGNQNAEAIFRPFQSKSNDRPRKRTGFTPRRGFTLVELLITISIIALMASMILFAFYAAQDAGKEAKTKALIAKLDAIIKAKWDSYKTRRVPVTLQDEPWQDTNNNGTFDPSPWAAMGPFDKNSNGIADPGEFLDYNGNGTLDANEMAEYYDANGNGTRDVYTVQQRQKVRVDALRDLIRMEMPDRWSDIGIVSGIGTTAVPYDLKPSSPPPNGLPNRATPAGLQSPGTFGTSLTAANVPQSSVWQAYFRRIDNAPVTASHPYPPTLEYQGAECLFMIVTSALAEEGDARDVFRPDDVKDVDGDGFPEFVDGWGQPIRFLRWAPGFQLSDLQIVATVNNTTASGSSLTISPPESLKLSSVPGAYVGGAVLALQTSAPYSIDFSNTARISGYQYNTGTNTATITVLTTAPSGKVAITAPDPFDPFGAYAAVTPFSFATYPLIYSAGANKCYGIVSDVSSGNAALTYATSTTVPNPFVLVSGSEMIGNAKDLTGEPNFVTNGWLDNIHNHMIGTR